MSIKKRVQALAGFTGVDKASLSEIDYIHLLTDEERYWFYRYIDNDMKAMFYNDGRDIVTDKKEQRRLNREKKHRQRDVYGQMNIVDSLQGPILLPRKKIKAAK